MESEVLHHAGLENEISPESKPEPYKMQIVWRNVALFALLHLGSVYGLYLLIFQAKLATVALSKYFLFAKLPHFRPLNILRIFQMLYYYNPSVRPCNLMCIFHLTISSFILAFLLYQIGVTGITAGCHRLWTHRTYKANLPLRIILVVMSTIAFQVTTLFASLTSIRCFISFHPSQSIKSEMIIFQVIKLKVQIINNL